MLIARVPMPGMVAVEPALKLPVIPAMRKLATLRALSTSESLVNTLPLTGVSSGVVLVSGTASGGSLTGVTLIVRVEVTGVVPSVTV